MRRYIAILLLFAGNIAAVYLPSQSDFLIIIASVALAFVGYLLLYTQLGSFSWKSLFIMVLCLRVTMIPAFPSLSDDIYRFYFDGMLVNQGIRPYRYLPVQLIDQFPEWKFLISEQLNSPHYYSVYPPFNQLLYSVAFYFSDGIATFSIILKSLYLLLEAVGIYMIFRYFSVQKQIGKAFLYAANPLVIIEGIGNLHIEVVMVSLLAVFILLWIKKEELWKQLIFYAMAIGVKLVPLLLAPFFFFSTRGKKKVQWSAFLITYLIILFLPILWSLDYTNFSQSLDLYFRKFEFNASIYYLLRYLGKLWSGYNQIGKIGPFLAMMVFVITLVWAFAQRHKTNKIQAIKGMAIIWAIYLFLSTTIHPWYIIPVLFLTTFSGLTFGVLWSFLVFLTYINYSYPVYQENLWMVAFEYVVLFGFIWYELGLMGKLAQRKWMR